MFTKLLRELYEIRRQMQDIDLSDILCISYAIGYLEHRILINSLIDKISYDENLELTTQLSAIKTDMENAFETLLDKEEEN